MFDPSSHKLLASRDAVFHENANKGNKMNDIGVSRTSNENDNHVKIDAVVEQEQEYVQVQEQDESNMDTSSSDGSPRRGEESPKCSRRDESSEGPRRSSRQNQPPLKYRDYALMPHVMNVVEPLNYEEAKEHKEWIDAMNEEYDAIMRNQT